MLQREIVGLPTTAYPVDEWALVETRFELDYLARTETIFSLGNGYVGIRGCVDEGRPYFDRGSYVNGLHETWRIHHAEAAYGFATTGQTIVPVPDARRFHLYVDGEPLHLPTADLEEYERRLDFRDGVLRRELLWRAPSGNLLRITTQRLVSMVHRHVIAIRYEVELLEGDAPITISSQLRHEVEEDQLAGGEGDPRQGALLGDVLEPEGQWCEHRRAVLRYRVQQSRLPLACAIDHDVTVEGATSTERCEVDERRGKLVVQVEATQGTRIRIDKFATYFTSVGASSRQLADRCARALDRAVQQGWDVLAADQRAWFDDAWARCDVVIEGNEVVQQAVRWSLFQLLQAAARAETTGIPAKGLTGDGYDGHYFWDTEIYVLPFLTYTLPAVARNLLRFRHTLLPHARRRAAELAQRGALFPWRTINGEEASSYYAAGTAQYHIDADISYALRKYVRATGDDHFLRTYGAELLVETARLYEDLGFHDNDSGDFHIHGVTGPDEYTTVVNDNAYTNLMARLNLHYAAEVVDELEHVDARAWERLVYATNLTPGEVARWREAAARMHIPHDAQRNITPQDASFLAKERWDFEGTPREDYPLLLHYHPLVIYRFQVIKQADIVLAMFLLPEQFADDTRRANFDYYDPITTGDSSLSTSIQSVVSAQLGEDARAIEYFRYGLFMDLADVAGNAEDGVHVAATGGVWLGLVYGFGGMRDDGDVLAFDPRLPATWARLGFAVTWRGQRLRVSITRFEVVYTHEDGDGELRLQHRGSEVVLQPGEKQTRGLTAGAHEDG